MSNSKIIKNVRMLNKLRSALPNFVIHLHYYIINDILITIVKVGQLLTYEILKFSYSSAYKN
jgi:hypothetical protein